MSQKKLLKTKHKIPAFTLSEMLVVIILTSIVVGIAFSVLTLVQKHMESIQGNFYKNTELNKLEQSLWIDFNRYSEIEFNAIENTLLFSNELDSVAYEFSNKTIIKSLDTLHITLQSKNLFFNGKLVQNGKIDAIKIETSNDFQNQKLFIFKKNDATLYLN